MGTIDFDELYESRQPLLFVLFFFTVFYFTRNVIVVFLLLILQIVLSIVVYNIIVDTNQHQIVFIDFTQFKKNHIDPIPLLPGEESCPVYWKQSSYKYVFDFEEKQSNNILHVCNKTSGMSILDIIFMQCVFSFLGILLSFWITLICKIPKYKVKNRSLWFQYVGECIILFLTFLYVDEKIEQTNFPIGIYRTFFMFTKVAFCIYYINRNKENVLNTWSKTHRTYSYDSIYMHWLLCCILMISLHFYFFVHGYYMTLIHIFGIGFLYSVVVFLYTVCKWSKKWNDMLDVCTKVEKKLFIG